MEKIVKDYVTAEQNNKMFEQGFKYKVTGDYTLGSSIDPWSGMPNVNSNTHFFTDKAEAEAYAAWQEHPFGEFFTATVYEVKHELTHAEWQDKFERERQERKDKEAARLARKAAEAGLTIEEYKSKVSRDRTNKRQTKDLECAKAEVARLEDELAKI